jgi:serine/threonine protein kinase
MSLGSSKWDTAFMTCPTCGKAWPGDATMCTDDGTSLEAAKTSPNVHVAETMPLPPRRDVGSNAPTGFSEARIDEAVAIRGSIAGAAPVIPNFESVEPVTFDANATSTAVVTGANFLIAKAGAMALARVKPRAEDDSPPVFDNDGATELDMDLASARSLVGTASPLLDDDLTAFDDEEDRQTEMRKRGRVAAALPSAAGTSSSDPPTGERRQFRDHIDLPPGSVVDVYEVEARLGAGAMGEVYAARHQKLGKRVAIKVMSPRLSADTDAIERFEQEARTLAMLHHPGIVDVIGFGELADHRAYFVMEHLHGESLEERLERERTSLDESLDILDQMARALEAAHAQQVVHRDLKPANTFLVKFPSEPRPTVKLLDFGLAKLAAAADRRAEQTQSGVVIGTAMYLSPEQCRGPNVDGRTDIYSLGCIAYELILGIVPFPQATSMTSLLAAHLHQTPLLPRSIWPEIPPALDLLLFGMLAKAAEHRPTLGQIRQVLASVRTPTRPLRAEARVQTAGISAAPRPRWPTFAIAAATLIGGIAIGAGLRSSDHAPAAASGVTTTTSGVTGNRDASLSSTTPADSSTKAVLDANTSTVTSDTDRVPIIDASVDAPRTGPSPTLKSKPLVDARIVDAEIQVDAESPMDAEPLHEIPPTRAKPEAPIEKHEPSLPKKPGRNDTINPFKRGSASR